MSRYLFLFIVLLTLYCVIPARAENKPTGDDKIARGGLVCRSEDGQRGQSCDALCAKAEMACTGVGAAKNPPLRCGDIISDTVAPSPVCRCCALEHR